jgi:hypothetical protein
MSADKSGICSAVFGKARIVSIAGFLFAAVRMAKKKPAHEEQA